MEVHEHENIKIFLTNVIEGFIGAYLTREFNCVCNYFSDDFFKKKRLVQSCTCLFLEIK